MKFTMVRLRLHTVLLTIAIINVFAAMGQFVFETQQHYEFEDMLKPDQRENWAWRSEAYNAKTLRVVDPNRTYTIELALCIQAHTGENVTVYLNDIRYSNDGPSDNVYVMVGDTLIGNFSTLEEWRHGHEWNIFRNSGRIGPTLIFRTGRYTMWIQVETDKWGVEFDRIRMTADNQKPTERLFCGGRLYKNS